MKVLSDFVVPAQAEMKVLSDFVIPAKAGIQLFAFP
jgi:hypothetical protein